MTVGFAGATSLWVAPRSRLMGAEMFIGRASLTAPFPRLLHKYQCPSANITANCATVYEFS